MAYDYLRLSQLDIYELLLTHKEPFIEASRQFGKTTTVLLYVLERLIGEPGLICRWIVPEKAQARTIIKPEIDHLQVYFGHDQFFFKSTDSVYEHQNGAKLYIYGCDDDSGKRLRGQHSDIIVCDEFGFWAHPEIVNNVLRPQLITTDGQLIFASTPSPDLGHEYYLRKGQAITENRFIQKTIHDNESLTEDQIAKEAEKHGGVSSESWRREYLCQEVAESERLVIPQYAPNHHDFDGDYQRPDYFHPYVGIDLGFQDKTAAIFGYWDFEKATLVIEDEVVLSNRTSREIADACLVKEGHLWGSLKPYLRIGDNELQQLHDLAQLHSYPVSATQKHDKLAYINRLSLRFQSDRIKIHKRCENLRYQLRVGLWNRQKTGFERGEKTGHLDCIDALIYLSRNVNETSSPFPQNRGMSLYTHYLPHQNDSDHPEIKALAEAFTSGSGAFGCPK